MRRASSRPIASPRPKPPDRPRRGAAVEALEDAVALLRAGSRGPRSATVMTAWPALGVRLDPHRRAARPVAQRVVEQDAHHARDRVGVAAAPARPVGQDRRDRGRALTRAQLELGRDGAHDLAQLDRLRAQRHGGVEAREVEQLARERRQPVELGARVVHLAQRVELVEPARADVLLEQLHRALEHRQRRAQLVRGGRDERAPRASPGGAAPPACASARARGRRPRRGGRRAASARPGPRA